MKSFLCSHRGWLSLLPLLIAVAVVLHHRTTAFARPMGLLGLLLMSPVVVLLALDARRRLEERHRFADPALLARMGEPRLQDVMAQRALLAACGLVLLLFAAARPKGGLAASAVAGTGSDVMLCLDVSNSMRVADMSGVSRLDAAKQLLRRFVAADPGDRIGVVAFAGVAHVMCPFTLDRGTLGTFLDDLDPGSVAKQGTRIGGALRAAVGRFDPHSVAGRAVLLLTDGEDHGSDPLGAAREARERGVVVHTIGLGTEHGGQVVMGTSLLDQPIVKRFHGTEVVSRLDEPTLQEVARLTGGQYYRAGSANRLEAILAEIARLNKTSVRGRKMEVREELFGWYLWPALLLLLWEPLVRLRRGGRRRT
ncbi:MAG: VWA domain-containing protein [Armatimonadetes bacterium]|nr:VWA domain-containing protein [Armatimonadota bacterium]